MRRLFTFTGSSVALALLALGLVSWSFSADAHLRFPVKWDEPRIAATVKPGATQQFDVKLTASYDLPKMSVFIGPKIKSYVTSTSTVGPLKKGQSAVVSLVVTAPITATPTTTEGLVFLVATSTKSAFKLPLPRPLLVKLAVVWPTLSDPRVPYAMQYPANWEAIVGDDGIVRLRGQVTTTIATNPADMGGLCKVVIRSNKNATLLPLPVWTQQTRQDSGSSLPISSTSITVGGLQGLQEVAEEIGITTTVYLAPNPTEVTSFQFLCGDEASHVGEAIFSAILSSVTFE